MSKDEITIIVPEAASGALVELTKYLCDKLGLDGGGGLGGQYGYGVDYENEIFMMHYFCWCEREDCLWCGPKDVPNFHYKPTDTKIWWYKWIGRGERMEGELPPDFLKICQESVSDLAKNSPEASNDVQ